MTLAHDMSPMRPKNFFAILVGIDRYENAAAFRQMKGCANDAKEMYKLLTEVFHVPGENIQVLVDEAATYERIQTAFREHFLDRLAMSKREQAVLFHFSGHGAYNPFLPH